MLTIEKVIILKSVSIFSQIPEETLIEVAMVAKERELRATEPVFVQGDMGTSLYVIITGQIKIHLGQQTLALLGQRQVFGELAALDPEPRSASATAVEETFLLEIDRNTLYELLGEYTELAQGIIQILCQRLRVTSKVSGPVPQTNPSQLSSYDTAEVVHRYLLFHYGTRAQQSPNLELPDSFFNFPVRCVSECLDFPRIKQPHRALDLGCSVGRSAFELSRHFAEVLAVDLSPALIDSARTIQKQRSVVVSLPLEGSVREEITVELPLAANPDRVTFEVGDALQPETTWGTFDCVLAANLLDRVPDPRQLLEVLTKLTAPQGQLILVSPYSWLEEYTPKRNWPTGPTFDFLLQELRPDFTLLSQKELPFLIREHARKFQWSSAQATVWIRN